MPKESNWDREQREKKERDALYRKYGIVARKHGGDDAGSWAVFIGQRLFIEGITHYEIPYYKKRALEHFQREINTLPK